MGEFLLRDLYFEQAFETEFIVSFILAGLIFCTSVVAISRYRSSDLSNGIRGLIGAASMTFVIMAPYAYYSLHGRGVDLGDMIFLYVMALPCGVLGLSMPIDRLILRRKGDA
jgi:hypothetical protein